jgi:preprotein translocase subunit SecD
MKGNNMYRISKHMIRLLISLLLLGFFITACSGSSQQTATPSVTQLSGTVIRITLKPVPGSAIPSSAQMNTASNILLERLTASGFKNAQIKQVTLDGQPALQVEVPQFNEKDRATLDQLLVTGLLEFWSTGPMPLPVDSAFDPTQFAQYNPGASAQFNSNDLDASKISVGQDQQTGRPDINLAMNSNASDRFYRFTQQNIGEYLTITLDKKVLMSAVINSAINGPFVISGSFTSQKAKDVADILKYNALPVTFQKVSEEIYTA